MLALDFDGLICDGLGECLLVTWNGMHGRPVDDFSGAGLRAIPEDFVRQFVHCRSFARHLGHFATAFAPGVLEIEDQASFEALYASFPAPLIENFVTKVNDYRQRARTTRERAWIDNHVLYPGMREFLGPRARELYIVTAKDVDSVAKILAAQDVHVDRRRVFGERRDKIPALREIAARETIAPAALRLVDDNLLNVIDARAAGFDGIWATWGYAAPAHGRLADERNVPRQSLDQFLAVGQA
jgi:phosphoglycolate phosphatase-like HAD superfamily hydrolase